MAYKFPVLAQDVEDSLGQDAPTVLELSRVAKTGRSYHTQLMLLQTRTQPCVMDRRRRTSKSSTHMNSQATCDNCVRIDGPKHRGDAHKFILYSGSTKILSHCSSRNILYSVESSRPNTRGSRARSLGKCYPICVTMSPKLAELQETSAGPIRKSGSTWKFVAQPAANQIPGT
ncbi:hypothetical protein TEQG_07114 [Trichophyton equinum CBS 127.97]|uniref:Uncharacterized protein n=1 Tax=Trichophyton equinum (strain ATCC MYA-4606 / CBS 127.97) TaxID=559882 RepID=F2Q1N0_TRIEC|nr:hypothetical protein TEQG_07114 [Trichophyton equinum CBS 127.97]